MTHYESDMKRGKDVLEAIDNSVSLRSRSLLSEWMRENYEGFKARLDEHVPSWTVLADLFADAGLTDRFGNRPKPQAVRRLWQRIKKEMQERPLGKPPRQPVRPTQPNQPAQTASPTPPGSSRNNDLESVLEAMKAKDRKFPDVV